MGTLGGPRDGAWMALTLFLALVITLGPLQVRGATGKEAPGAGMGAAPGVVWRFATGGRPLLGAPVAGRDGTLYAAAAGGVLYAVAPNGSVRWTLPSGAVSTGAAATRPAVGADGASYWNLQGGVVAVDAMGHVRWVFLAGPTSAPVLSQGRVLVVAGAYLYAIAASGATAGRRLWRAAIGADSGGAAGGSAPAAPAVGPDGTAYVAASDGYLYAIAPTGLRRWAFRTGAPLLFSPAVGLDGAVYLSSFANGRGALDALAPDGRPRWRLTIPVGGDVVRGPDGTLYVAARLLVAVSPRGRVLWRRVVDAVAPVTVAGLFVVAPSLSPPALLAFGTDGTPRWRLPLASAAIGAPARGPSGRLYSGDYTGMLTALAPGARGGRLIQGAARPSPAVDLGASNPPYIARRGAVSWRVTLAGSIERGAGGARWRTVLSPGVSLPDARTGRYRNARYADVTFLSIDPHNARALYVGTVGALGDYLSGGRGGADGGLYYSADGATGWRRLTSGLPFTIEPRLRAPAYGLDSLVFDPARLGVLYAQTPTSFGSPGHDAGLYESVDGGTSWREATRGLQAVIQANALLGAYRAYPPGPLLADPVPPGHPTVLFLVTPSGLYRSADAAERWTRVVAVRYTDPTSVAVRLGPGGVVRVYTDRGFYRSGDYGVRWTGR